MDRSLGEFSRIVIAVLKRFHAQASRPVAMGQLAQFAKQLAAVVEERGLPTPLRDGECGAPGGMSDAECALLMARVVQGLTDPLLADAARQLVKACFYPEFKVCRDSFREVARDGACRRQQLERVLGRLSGSHCVDCPHWVALDAAEHVGFLTREWRADPREFAAHLDVFLPEDFRALRRWLHAAARATESGRENT